METTDLSHHILSRFNADLEGVRSAVLQMGGLVEQQLLNGVKALYSGDGRLGEEIVRLDHKVNAMEVAIDDDCSRILATRNPTASDLRLIVAVIKTITDLERIGDEGWIPMPRSAWRAGTAPWTRSTRRSSGSASPS
jgi:phosphate transport system protein